MPPRPPVDENTPLQQTRPSTSMRTLGTSKPSTSRASLAVRSSTPPARTSPRLSSSAALKARNDDATVEIQVHQPTSDPVEEKQTVQGPPTPPASQSPPTLSSRRAGSSQPLSIKLNSSQTSHALLHPSTLPLPSRSRSRSTSTSAKPKPSLSTTTARRASASPAPKPRMSKGKKLAPRPSETLDQVPWIGLESEGEDPLLLRGGEEMRGWGEGKPTWRGVSASASAGSGGGRRSVSRSRSKSTGVQVEMVDRWDDADLVPLGSGTMEEEQDLGGYEDWGAGFASSDGESERDTVFIPSAQPQPKEYHESIYDYIVPLAPVSSSPPPRAPVVPSFRPTAPPTLEYRYDLPSPFLRRPFEPPRSSSAIAFSARHPSTALPSDTATFSRAASVEPKDEEEDEEEQEAARERRRKWANGEDFFRSSTSPPGEEQVFRTPSLTASSPDLEEPQQGPCEYEEEGVEIILVGQSMSPNEIRKRSESPPQVEPSSPPAALPLHDSLVQPTEDTTMSSPITRSPPRTLDEDAAMASPLRRPLEDSRMASPSPRRQPASALRHGSATEEDAVMGSPSPVRRAAVPASVERLRMGGKVGEGRLLLAKKLAGLGCAVELGGTLGVKLVTMAKTTPAASTPRAAERATPQASTSTLTSASTAPSQPPTSHSTSTPLAHLLNAQSNTFTPQLHPTQHSTLTASRRSSRPRPSHPTLPIIEVSSTDPRAAARAAAILKVYHAYVEQGLEAPSEDSEEENEEERREMLEHAEEEVLQRVVPRYAPSSVSSMRGAHEMPGALNRAWTSGSPAPSTAQMGWTSMEWRRLETALVEESRAAKEEGRESGVDDVVWAFLGKEGLGEEDCEGAWEWSKLVVRVDALRERRARDSMRRSSRASSISSPLPPTLDTELLQASSRATASSASTSLAPPRAHRRSVSPAASSNAARKVRVVEESPALESSDEDEDDLDHDPTEDTFFERRNVHASPPQVDDETPPHPPLALAGSRFAHLYDDPVVKPPLPAQSWEAPRRPEDDSTEYDDSFDRSSVRSSTLEEGGARQAPPSSARKLFSYLGSFVRRPSASPGPETGEARLQASIVVPAFASTSQPFPSQANLRPTPSRPVRPLPPAVPSTSRRRSSGEGKVWDQVAALEDAESSREEDAKVLRSLQSESVKRKASVAELRGVGLAPRIVYGTSPAMIPSGTRALDRPIGEKAKPRGS